MIRKHFGFWATIFVILAAAVLGLVKRTSYTNITAAENYMEQLVVGEIPEQIAIYSCDELKQMLPGCPVILRVAVDSDIEYLSRVGRQKVCIQEIYAGEGLEVGQDIYVFSEQWRICMSDGLNSVERGFVNIMDVGTEYLIFAVQKTEDLKGNLPVYQLYDESFIVPVFCYDERVNKIMPVGEEHTYVSYTSVKDNEFFAASEKGLAAWEKLKSEMLTLYPAD